MANPVLVYNASYVYFTCDRDPTGTESVVSGYGIPSTWMFYWWNTTTNDVFVCQNGSATPLVWWKIATSLNFASMLSSTGWKLNTARSYSSQSLTFGTARTPSATNDTFVVCNVTMAITVLQTCTITAQINPGSGFTTINQVSLNVAAASTVGDALSFIVPANSQYKIVSAGTGTNTIVSAYELTM